jgi:pyruvate/2-oxoglutarate dehydrogenase complex dihydrolipoamide dehydrogenase (E3) component
MAQAEHFDALVLGSGPGGILLAWHLARFGQRVAVVERRYVGGSCPNIACMPSKNESGPRQHCEHPSIRQRPKNLADRFSMKLRTPSVASSEACSRPCSFCN